MNSTLYRLHIMLRFKIIDLRLERQTSLDTLIWSKDCITLWAVSPEPFLDLSSLSSLSRKFAEPVIYWAKTIYLLGLHPFQYNL